MRRFLVNRPATDNAGNPGMLFGSSPGVANSSDTQAFGMPFSKPSNVVYPSQYSQNISASYASASQGSQVSQGTAQPSVSLQRYSSQPLLHVKNRQDRGSKPSTLTSLQRLIPPCNCNEETNQKFETLCNRIVGIVDDISQMKSDLGHLKDHSSEKLEGRFQQLIVQTVESAIQRGMRELRSEMSNNMDASMLRSQQREEKETNTLAKVDDRREYPQHYSHGRDHLKRRPQGKMTDFMQVTKNQNHEMMQLSPICLSIPRGETTGEAWPVTLQNQQNWISEQAEFTNMMPCPPALEDPLSLEQPSKKKTSMAKRKRAAKGKQHKIDEYSSFHVPSETNFPKGRMETVVADVDSSFCTKEDADAVKKMVLRARKKRKVIMQ